MTDPAPSAATPTAKAAMSAGRNACKGKSPATIRRAFLNRARHTGGDKHLLELAAHPSKALRQSPAYAGMAAALYASSRPKAQRRDAFAGCAFELRRVSKTKGSSR
jgi:hypothetical protein